MAHKSILIINAGSSSIKFQLFTEDNGSLTSTYSGLIEGINTEKTNFKAKDNGGNVLKTSSYENEKKNHQDMLTELMDWLHTLPGLDIVAAGHRVVHGGMRFSGPAKVDDEVIQYLTDISPMAPNHNPHNVLPMKILKEMYPTLPQVACFDTAFHRTAPAVNQEYAIPKALTEKGLIRYGMHGLSYEYISSQLKEYLPFDLARGKVVVAHLGNGASMCSLEGGLSTATTMGFTPLDGLTMSTRAGQIDPGLILYLIREEGMSVDEVEELIAHKSGLLGISGMTSDMRPLQTSHNPDCIKAVDMFVLSVAQQFGRLVATMGGIDALIFTGGIGENSVILRRAICEKLAWFGIDMNFDSNEVGARYLSTSASKIPVLRLETNEELMIAGHTLNLLNTSK